jgi:hypothetical protein
MVRVNYINSNDDYIDDIVIRFGNYSGITVEENPYWDVRSLNSVSFLASLKGTASLAIQTRPLTFITDTVGLRVVSATSGNFRLFFNEFENFAYAKDILIWDLYTNTQQSLLQNSTYHFTITGDPASQGYNRFKMIFIAEQLFVTAPNITVSNEPGSGGANVNFSASAYSKCSNNINFNYSIPSGSYFPIGTTNVQLEVTDDCGNIKSSTFSVKVNDVDAPVISNVTGVVVQNNPGKCTSSFVPAAPSATDNSGSASVSGTRNDGAALNASYPKGITTITWKAVDLAGNVSTTTQKITVVDAEAPIITPISMQAGYEANFSGCSYHVQNNELDPSYMDLCSPVTLTNNITNSSSLAGVLLPLGTTFVIWTARDDAGNATSWTQTINIISNLTANIPDVKAIASGVNANTIYIGYSPASSLTYSSSSASSYNWSVSTGLSIAGANNLATVKVTSTSASASSYALNLTVTDQFGCSATASKAIHVIDIRCGAKNDKVQVCSPQGSLQCVAINNTLLNNLTKGYKLGSCTSILGRGVAAIEELAPSVSAYPNPTSGLFVLELKDMNAGVAEVQITDMLGRTVVNQKLNITQRKEQLNLNLANKAAGVYNIRVSTQDGVQLTKVVLAQ